MARFTEDHVRLASMLTVAQLRRVSYADAIVGLSRDVQKDVAKLVRASCALERLATAACNRELSDREAKRQAKLEADVERIAKDYGLTAEVCGDPRGYVVKLRGLGVSNELGGDWGVA